MSDLRFSIVIPTRERAETLRYTLRTCLAQQFDGYEIVVCDNCSSAATRETVDSFESAKIKYVRSDRPLAMSENWELAVSHAVAEYVIVIGDDDGLLFHALREVDRLLQVSGVKALRWERVHYNWPNVPGGETANRLHIPLVRENRILQGRKVIPRIVNHRMNYTMLPMLYNSAIHQDLITLLRKRTGRVFGASNPDIYSGFAFAYLAQRYASVGYPMSINAGSAKSTGHATMGTNGSSPIAREFRLLSAKAGLGLLPQIPDIPHTLAMIADSFQRAKDALFPDDSNLRLDRKRLVSNCVQALRLELDSEEEWRRSLQAIHDSLTDDIDLQRWFDSEFSDRASLFQSRAQRPAWKKGFDGRDLRLNAADFGVADVFGAAELCENILGYTVNEVEWWPRQGKVVPEYLWKRLRSAARILLKGW